jgi:hypothetical protein
MNPTCAAGTEYQAVAMRAPGGIGFIACHSAVPAHAAATAISESLHSMRRGLGAMAMGRLPAAA